MNANELADDLEYWFGNAGFEEHVAMLRQQQTKLAAAEQVIQSIANEQVELSHDKIKWQNADHIRWCKKFIEEYNK